MTRLVDTIEPWPRQNEANYHSAYNGRRRTIAYRIIFPL
jgi:hypothetical protein